MNYRLKHNLTGDILEIKISGKSTDSSFLDYEIQEILNLYSDKNIILDVHQLASQPAIEEMDLNGNRYYGDQGKSKIAILDSEDFSSPDFSVFMPIQGKGTHIRFFRNQSEAATWLKS